MRDVYRGNGLASIVEGILPGWQTEFISCRFYLYPIGGKPGLFAGLTVYQNDEEAFLVAVRFLEGME